MDKFVQTNGIQLHFLQFEGNQPALILMHGLTANAHAFDGLLKAGLNPKFQAISVDLRGRGLSDKPEQGYKMSDHAADIVGMMDELGLQKAVMCGHSFGAFLGLYIAIHYPERVDKLIMLDAAAQMNPRTREMLGDSLGRLDKIYPSFEDFLNTMKKAPYLDYWEDTMTSYYRADVQDNPDGTVRSHTKLDHILEAIQGPLSEPWLDFLQKVEHPTILVNAPGVYNLGEALLPEELARQTVQMMKNCTYAKVWGNHQTMLYGQGAKEIVEEISKFLI